MSVQVTTYKSVNFQNDVNALSFKENNFTFKRTRSLAIMIAENSDYSHIVKLEKEGFQKPLYRMKIQKDLAVVLILENPSIGEYKLTFLRAIRLRQLDEIVEKLDTDETCIAFNFKDFWA